MKMRFLILTFLLSSNLFAEYRVYQYLIQSDNESKYITSSLDPISFKSYHGGKLVTKIDLLRTWMCPGFTGHKKEYCPSPYEKMAGVTDE